MFYKQIIWFCKTEYYAERRRKKCSGVIDVFFFSFVCPEDSACLQRVGGQVQGTHEAGKDAKG